MCGRYNTRCKRYRADRPRTTAVSHWCPIVIFLCGYRVSFIVRLCPAVIRTVCSPVYCSISRQRRRLLLLVTGQHYLRASNSIHRLRQYDTGDTDTYVISSSMVVRAVAQSLTPPPPPCNIHNIAAGHAFASSENGLPCQCLFFVDRPNILSVASTNWLDWITAQQTETSHTTQRCY